MLMGNQTLCETAKRLSYQLHTGQPLDLEEVGQLLDRLVDGATSTSLMREPADRREEEPL